MGIRLPAVGPAAITVTGREGRRCGGCSPIKLQLARSSDRKSGVHRATRSARTEVRGSYPTVADLPGDQRHQAIEDPRELEVRGSCSARVGRRPAIRLHRAGHTARTEVRGSHQLARTNYRRRNIHPGAVVRGQVSRRRRGYIAAPRANSNSVPGSGTGVVCVATLKLRNTAWELAQVRKPSRSPDGSSGLS